MSKLIEGEAFQVDGVLWWANAEQVNGEWDITVYAEIPKVVDSCVGGRGHSVRLAVDDLSRKMRGDVDSYHWVGYVVPSLIARKLHDTLVAAR